LGKGAAKMGTVRPSWALGHRGEKMNTLSEKNYFLPSTNFKLQKQINKFNKLLPLF
jgi:hypothetical protein